MNPSRSTVAVIVALFIATVALAATKGDLTSKGRHGSVCVSGDDGGINVGTRIIAFQDGGSAQIPGANAFNVLNPTGSNGTVCCGFTAAVHCGAVDGGQGGYPLTPGQSIGIDVTCPGGGRNPADPCPSLFCVTQEGVLQQQEDGGIGCMRWLQVE